MIDFSCNHGLIVVTYMLSAEQLRRTAQERKANIMPRTAPTINGTPTMRRVSFTFVDKSNDQRSVSIYVETLATNAQMEAAVVALGVATNANLWRVEITEIYNSIRLPIAAISAPEISVYDNIVILYKEASSPNAEDFFLVAPKRLNFVGDTDNPDSASAELIAVRDTVNALLIGTTAAVSLRYTERTEKNAAVPASS